MDDWLYSWPQDEWLYRDIFEPRYSSLPAGYGLCVPKTDLLGCGGDWTTPTPSSIRRALRDPRWIPSNALIQQLIEKNRARRVDYASAKDLLDMYDLDIFHTELENERECLRLIDRMRSRRMLYYLDVPTPYSPRYFAPQVSSPSQLPLTTRYRSSYRGYLYPTPPKAVTRRVMIRGEEETVTIAVY